MLCLRVCLPVQRQSQGSVWSPEWSVFTVLKARDARVAEEHSGGRRPCAYPGSAPSCAAHEGVQQLAMWVPHERAVSANGQRPRALPGASHCLVLWSSMRITKIGTSRACGCTAVEGASSFAKTGVPALAPQKGPLLGANYLVSAHHTNSLIAVETGMSRPAGVGAPIEAGYRCWGVSRWGLATRSQQVCMGSLLVQKPVA